MNMLYSSLTNLLIGISIGFIILHSHKKFMKGFSAGESTLWKFSIINIASIINVIVNDLCLTGVEQALGTCFGAALILLSSIDIQKHVIPNKLIFYLCCFCIISRTFVHGNAQWWEFPSGGVLAGMLFFVIVWLTKGGFGGGDLKLFAVCGYFISVKLVIHALILTTITGAIYATLIMILSKRKKIKFPYGPSISIASMLVYWFIK